MCRFGIVVEGFRFFCFVDAFCVLLFRVSDATRRPPHNRKLKQAICSPAQIVTDCSIVQASTALLRYPQTSVPRHSHPKTNASASLQSSLMDWSHQHRCAWAILSRMCFAAARDALLSPSSDDWLPRGTNLDVEDPTAVVPGSTTWSSTQASQPWSRRRPWRDLISSTKPRCPKFALTTLRPARQHCRFPFICKTKRAERRETRMCTHRGAAHGRDRHDLDALVHTLLNSVCRLWVRFFWLRPQHKSTVLHPWAFRFITVKVRGACRFDVDLFFFFEQDIDRWGTSFFTKSSPCFMCADCRSCHIRCWRWVRSITLHRAFCGSGRRSGSLVGSLKLCKVTHRILAWCDIIIPHHFVDLCSIDQKLGSWTGRWPKGGWHDVWGDVSQDVLAVSTIWLDSARCCQRLSAGRVFQQSMIRWCTDWTRGMAAQEWARREVWGGRWRHAGRNV